MLRGEAPIDLLGGQAEITSHHKKQNVFRLRSVL
jgi:hypothetical protein